MSGVPSGLNRLEQAHRPGTFLRFYHGEWDRMLTSAVIPGLEGASWDRRAAWLYWLLLGNEPTDVSAELMLNTKPKEITTTHRVVQAPPSPFEDLI